MYYVRIKDDKHARRWKVREAVSLRAALECITHAMVTGSVGGKDTQTIHGCEGREDQCVTLANVVRVNPDNTEVKPS